MSDDTSTMPPPAPIVKEKKVKTPPDMTKVRDAKVKKQKDRDDTLSTLQNQLSSMASMMKTDMKSDVDAELDDDGPVCVTRKKQKIDNDGPSLKNEIFKTALVGLCGVGAWYASNVMFTPKQTSVIDRIAAPVITKTSVTPPLIPPTPTTSPSFPSMKKRLIGASGLYE